MCTKVCVHIFVVCSMMSGHMYYVLLESVLQLNVYKTLLNHRGIMLLEINIISHIFVINIGQCPAEAKDMDVHHQEVTHRGGGRRRHRTRCRKRWEDLRRWSHKIAEARLGVSSLSGRGAHQTLTPLMERVLAVAYPQLAGRLRDQQQPEGG